LQHQGHITEENEWGPLNHFSNVGNANIQYMKPDFRIAKTRLLQNMKDFFSIEVQTGQRHTNEIIVKF